MAPDSARPPGPGQAGSAKRAGDHGLFGPGSVTWRVMSQPVMWIAGIRAMYLQALHPVTMRGTWQNTALADRDQAWGRFLRTTEFVRVRTYGSMAEVERAGRRIRKIHASLTGVAEDGTVFRLDEPELLLWVHCGEVASYADVARRSGVPVSPAELDEFVSEQRRGAALVGLDPGRAPATMAELDHYFARMRPRLRACPEARQALLRSFTPKLPAEFWPLALMLPSLNGLAFASLPRWARRLYGLPASPVTDLAATAALRAAYESSSRVPPRLLFMPAAAVARRRRDGARSRDRGGGRDRGSGLARAS